MHWQVSEDTVLTCWSSSHWQLCWKMCVVRQLHSEVKKFFCTVSCCILQSDKVFYQFFQEAIFQNIIRQAGGNVHFSVEKIRVRSVYFQHLILFSMISIKTGQYLHILPHHNVKCTCVDDLSVTFTPVQFVVCPIIGCYIMLPEQMQVFTAMHAVSSTYEPWNIVLWYRRMHRCEPGIMYNTRNLIVQEVSILF